MHDSLNWNDEADYRLTRVALAEGRVPELAETIAMIRAAGDTPHPELERKLRSAEVVAAGHRRAYCTAADHAMKQHGAVA